MLKINWKQVFLTFIWIFLIALLVYTRLANLDWGLPYTMHPDERNMATAIEKLTCKMPTVTFNFPEKILDPWQVFDFISVGNFDFNECLNPHFFAYGQLPLYLSYILILIVKYFQGFWPSTVNFIEATLALRFLSATASIATAFILLKSSEILLGKNKYKKHPLLFIGIFLVYIFIPYAIQFSHFGTTESFLMFFYAFLIHLSLQYSKKMVSTTHFIILSSLLMGAALATKISSLIFLGIPAIVLILYHKRFKKKQSITATKTEAPFFLYQAFNIMVDLVFLMTLSILLFVLFSPHTVISWEEFLGSMKYESEVALGKSLVFYTRQFIDTIPGIFQTTKIFPFAFGMPLYVLGFIGFFFLSWKKKEMNMLRLAVIFYFMPNAFFFAKWTRFISPVFPLISLLAAQAVVIPYQAISEKISSKKIKGISVFLVFLLFGLSILPGIGYLSVYMKPDTRFEASRWIYDNIPEKSYILSETANVVDIPLSASQVGKQSKNYDIISFNFYDLDSDLNLQTELEEHLEKANYIFVPSRRVFADHSCFYPEITKNMNFEINRKNKCQKMLEKYPQLNAYYEKLFNGQLGFEKVAEFSSYPEISLFGRVLIRFPDEQAEETWSVFDHPVIRIYKRI